MTIQADLPPRPTYKISEEFICEKCSKPRIYVRTDYLNDYLEYDCPINRYAPAVIWCRSFSRDPGVD